MLCAGQTTAVYLAGSSMQIGISETHISRTFDMAMGPIV
jgi:hypothetical protein